MDTKSPGDFSSKIIQAMASLKISNDFYDLKVKVGDKTFSCHSFVLLSTSEFFRCQYRTLQKEEKDMTLQVSDISESTFQLILDFLYTGANPLTMDNIEDVWHAVHQLQITVLIKLCEDFIVAQLSPDNLAMYKSIKQSDYFESPRVRIGIIKFIIKNFTALRKTEIFLNLDMEDLKQVVESEELAVESEDVVLQSVYEWVNSNATDRKKYLADLLLCTRYCVISDVCIEDLSLHSLTLNDSRVNEIFNKATAFKLDGYARGFWPSAAIHREFSGHEHVAVYNAVTTKFAFVSLNKNTLIKSADTPSLNAKKLAVANGKLVACRDNGCNIELFAEARKMWHRVNEFKLEKGDKCFCMLPHEYSVFMITLTKMFRFDPNNWNTKFQECTYDIASPKHAMSFYSQILVFSAVVKGELQETAVHAWRSGTKTWSRLETLQFTASSMASFKDDKNAYILDKHGQFWKLTHSNTVLFTYIGKMWDLNLKLRGALLFKKSLYLFLAQMPAMDELNLKSDLGSGIFQDVKFQITGKHVSNVLHVIKDKESLYDL